MKLLVMPSKLDIKDTINYTDGYIFGIKGYSVNTPFDINLEQLKEINKICKENNKELFISLNKNIYSRELDDLKELLTSIEELNLNGILYADTCFINLKKELNLITPIIWSQEHLTTNYNTINLWCSYGADGAYLSPEITLREIKEIRENTNSTLIVPIFGYIPIFTSKRHMLNNYVDNFNLKDNSNINYIEKEEKIYPIIDNTEGTVTYSNNILNGINELNDLNEINYLTLNSFDINEDTFLEILKIYNHKSDKKIEELIENIDTGFLHKETIYKVKNHE